ncbi:dockerin type I repeat-containing protein [Ruminococcus sp.]|uniref:dockerin type I repeat-containing protein n=1 Tax=Ruminococcus sp. TaxID=41978 RepID=UPI0025E0BBC1|nr:dockerin type I repeat-containing protein [Ruminococcus sp.]MCR4638634.1 dockerin type I repeat-containing protein [Ruminococcus sp.]
MLKKLAAAVIAATIAIIPFSAESLDLFTPLNAYSEETTDGSENDINSWLPDCEAEFKEYVKKYGAVSVRDNYVVFCMDSNNSIRLNWSEESQEYLDNFKMCSTKYFYNNSTGDTYKVAAYQAVKDGQAAIKWWFVPNYVWELDPPFSKEDMKDPLVADCTVIDNAQTVLLSGDMRVSLVDYDTGELLSLPDGAISRIWTDIRQDTPEGELNCNIQPSGLRNNPEIVHLGNFFNGYDFSFGLLDIPESYSLPETEEKSAGYYNGTIVPEDHITVKKYDNNTADVVFRLKKKTKRVIPEEKSADLTDLKKGETRITVYDKDTGELIPNDLLEHHYCGFGTDIRFEEPNVPGGWMMTGPIYAVGSNPQVYQTGLANLYRSADYFEFLCDDQPEVTLYDNGSMDLVIRTKIKVSGNINGDGEFSIADLVALQKWLLNAYDNDLYSWGEADFNLDNKLDIFDLVLMRKELIKKTITTYVEPDQKV